MMVDHEIDAREELAEVVRLHVDRRDAVEAGELGRRDRLHLDVEQVGHPDVLGPRDSLERRDDGGRPRPAQDVAKGETSGQRVRVGLVVEQDQDAVGIREVPLILLDARARERSSELGRERGGQQLRQIEVRDLGNQRTQLLLSLAVRSPDLQDVDQAAARVADGTHDALEAAAPVVFDDDAGRGAEVRAKVGIEPGRIGDRNGHAFVDQTPREGPVLDQELHVERAGENPMQGPDDQLVLTDGQRTHNR